MTEDKARKRAIRSRMTKTGERYTAARRHVGRALPPRAADPGLSEKAVLRGTGKGWDEWFRILDDWGATSRTHGEIAAYLGAQRGVGPWWTQGVTVGYERARGMRRPHQGSHGFRVDVSRTFPVGVMELCLAFEDDRRRRRWLEAGTLKLRTSRRGKSARYDFRDGTSRVHAYFISKGRGKSSLAIQHERLPDADDVEEMRAFWKERLTRLGEILASR
jgi:hypothetical protein